MRHIAIVGAGQAGLQLAFGLLANGYQVSVFTDRDQEAIRTGRVMGTACMWNQSLVHERDLNLNQWDNEARFVRGIHLDFIASPGNPLFTVRGAFRAPALAIDQRMKFAGWMDEFERRGGTLKIQALQIADLDAMAKHYDLVVVATGRSAIAEVFGRDARRSVHSTPQRHLAVLLVRGLKQRPDVPSDLTRFTFSEKEGEVFWVPLLDASGPCHSLIFEPRIGGALDRFIDAQSGEEMIARVKEVINGFAPWENESVRSIELTDPMAWATGSITPVVRRGAARLPSGSCIMGVGDAVILNDPCGGQGAQCASKAAHFLTGRIVARGEQPFNIEWMEQQFEDFWQQQGRHIAAFSNLMLAPLTAPAKEVLLAASKVGSIADAFFNGFDDPRQFWPWINDMAAARAFITEKSGSAWWWTAMRSRMSIAAGQVAHHLGARSLPLKAHIA